MQVVRSCKGLPLAIKVIATSLRNQPNDLCKKIVKEMSQGHSMLDSTNLLTCLKKFLDVLEDSPIMEECFIDLALFPEDRRISVAALIDVWTELYELDDNGIEAMEIINKLGSMNLANVLIARKSASDADSYNYNNHFVVLHDLLRDLGIYQTTKEPIERRKRLIFYMNENNCFAEKQQRLMNRLVSTDETCASDWSQMQPAQAEGLILKLHTKQYLFPDSIEKMSLLKVLIITNYGFHPSELNNFELLDSLHNLKRIRLERVFVPSSGTLKNLRKLSLYLCTTRMAFEKDISNCISLSSLPEEFGNLCNLRNLYMAGCTSCELPFSVVNLTNLKVIMCDEETADSFEAFQYELT